MDPDVKLKLKELGRFRNHLDLQLLILYPEDLLKIAKIFCTRCFKKETVQHFSLCGRCELVPYCSRECQTVTWQNHKVHCKKSEDPATSYEKIAAKRKETFQTLEKRLETVEIEPSDLEVLQREFLSKGVFYRYFLREECMAALVIGDEASFLKSAKLYKWSDQERFQNEFPDRVAEKSQEYHQRILYLFMMQTQYIYRPLLAVKGEVKDYSRLIKVVEPEKKPGTRFLNRGYSQPVVEALELFRMKVIAILGPIFDSPNLFNPLNLNQYLMIWAYQKMATLPSCIAIKKDSLLIQGIQQEKPALMLTCFNWIPIFEQLVEDPIFIATLNQTGFSRETFEKAMKVSKSKNNKFPWTHLPEETLSHFLKGLEKILDPSLMVIKNMEFDVISLNFAGFFLGKMGLKPHSKHKK